MAEASFSRPDPELAARLEKFRQEHAGDPLGDVASRALYEDDRVKIWEFRLEPGQISDLHRHDRDYYLVMLQGDKVAGVPGPDSDDGAVVIELPEGGCTMRIPKGATEWAVNVGEKTFYEILIELKD